MDIIITLYLYAYAHTIARGEREKINTTNTNFRVTELFFILAVRALNSST